MEHPVSEMITGTDLVEWQLKVSCFQNLEVLPSLQGCKVVIRITDLSDIQMVKVSNQQPKHSSRRLELKGSGFNPRLDPMRRASK